MGQSGLYGALHATPLFIFQFPRKASEIVKEKANRAKDRWGEGERTAVGQSGADTQLLFGRRHRRIEHASDAILRAYAAS